MPGNGATRFSDTVSGLIVGFSPAAARVANDGLLRRAGTRREPRPRDGWDHAAVV